MTGSTDDDSQRIRQAATAELGKHRRLRDGTFDGVAREITDEAELAAARAALCDTVNPVDYDECMLHLRGLPSRAKSKHCTAIGSRPAFRSSST